MALLSLKSFEAAASRSSFTVRARLICASARKRAGHKAAAGVCLSRALGGATEPGRSVHLLLVMPNVMVEVYQLSG